MAKRKTQTHRERWGIGSWVRPRWTWAYMAVRGENQGGAGDLESPHQELGGRGQQGHSGIEGRWGQKGQSQASGPTAQS